MQLARIFPRKTTATPTDKLAFVGNPPPELPGIDKINISVTFTYDLPAAEELAKSWRHIAPIEIGGPATGMAGEEFIPGRYLKLGYTITSRGCPNKCWFCHVWRREGDIRELDIKKGYNVLDDNLLACSENHINEVFKMLKTCKHPAELTGGLESARLKRWHIDEILKIRLKQLFLAYDEPDDYEPLTVATNMFKEAGLIRKSCHKIRCYVLIGYHKDTIELALKRLKNVVALGVMPMAMLWRSETGEFSKEWKQFQRKWANPIILGTKMKNAGY